MGKIIKTAAQELLVGAIAIAFGVLVIWGIGTIWGEDGLANGGKPITPADVEALDGSVVIATDFGKEYEGVAIAEVNAVFHTRKQLLKSDAGKRFGTNGDGIPDGSVVRDDALGRYDDEFFKENDLVCVSYYDYTKGTVTGVRTEGRNAVVTVQGGEEKHVHSAVVEYYQAFAPVSKQAGAEIAVLELLKDGSA